MIVKAKKNKYWYGKVILSYVIKKSNVLTNAIYRCKKRAIYWRDFTCYTLIMIEELSSGDSKAAGKYVKVTWRLVCCTVHVIKKGENDNNEVYRKH